MDYIITHPDLFIHSIPKSLPPPTLAGFGWFGLVYWGLTPQQQPGSYQGDENDDQSNQSVSQSVSQTVSQPVSQSASRIHVRLRIEDRTFINGTLKFTSGRGKLLMAAIVKYPCLKIKSLQYSIYYILTLLVNSSEIPSHLSL